MTDLLHHFQSSKSDGADATKVRKTEWNDAHYVSTYKAATAPIYVASYDASDAEKAMALLSGGTVADGTSDNSDIDSALSLGKVVQCIGPTWNMGAQSIIASGKTLLFHNGMTISPASDLDCFKVQEGGTLIGNKALIDYRTGSRVGSPIVIETYTNATARPLNYRVEGFRLRGQTGASKGTAFNIPVKAGNSWLWGGQFRDITIEGFSYGVAIDATGAQTWVNSCLFDNFIYDDCQYPIYLSAVGGLGLDASHFTNQQMQYSTYNVCGLTVLGSITRAIRNVFDIVYWDWTGGAGSAMDLQGCYNTVYHSGLPNPESQIVLSNGGGDGVYNTLVDESAMSSDRKVNPLLYKKGADKTISGGAFSLDRTGGYFLIDTEGGAATDDLTDIYSARMGTAAIYIFSLKNAAHNVVFKNSATFRLKGGTDKTLDLITDVIAMMYDSTIGAWVELFDNI